MNKMKEEDLESGYYYIKTEYPPFYNIVSVLKITLGVDAGKFGVWSTDEEGYNLIDDYGIDCFISKVPHPRNSDIDILIDYINHRFSSREKAEDWIYNGSVPGYGKWSAARLVLNGDLQKVIDVIDAIEDGVHF